MAELDEIRTSATGTLTPLPPADDPGPNSVLGPGHTLTTVTEKVSDLSSRPLREVPRQMFIGFGIAFLLVNVLLLSVVYLMAWGVGVWGIRIPIAWGFAIVNFVWWIGIGHAGTAISAIFLLTKQDWRTSINRFAESMTLFAVSCAGLYPILHLGRPWLFYWLMPYPNSMGVWPQPRSPLIWDAFAISTYFAVSLAFWFTGMIPDMAALRDLPGAMWRRKLFGMLALGWRGSAKHWARYQNAYLLFAGLATPLVVSVHSVVSFDFSIGIIPGWHTKILPPYFVAGALYSGFAMVLTLVIPVRSWYGLHDLITQRHIEAMSKVMLGMGLIVAYGYLMDAFTAWYGDDPYERFLYWNKAWGGHYWWGFWLLLLCNTFIPQAIWSARVRKNVGLVFVISLLVNVGTWLDHFILVVVSLERDFLPSSWGQYFPTVWDWATFAGTIGLFLGLMFLLIRGLPIIAMFELREKVPAQPAIEGGDHGD